MAEVLITLGIIGIVAALTLPSLIADYRNEAYVRQLQKSINTIENGLKKAIADDEVDSLTDTALIQSITGSSYYSFGGDRTFESNLKKYFKIISVEPDIQREFAQLNGSSKIPYAGVINFADGTSVMEVKLSKMLTTDAKEKCELIKSLGGNTCATVGRFYIDVNGYKKPNKFGRDVFFFSVTDNGRLLPHYGKDAALLVEQVPLETNSSYWGTTISLCGERGKPLSRYANGTGCAARIIENGWKIDY